MLKAFTNLKWNQSSQNETTINGKKEKKENTFVSMTQSINIKLACC